MTLGLPRLFRQDPSVANLLDDLVEQVVHEAYESWREIHEPKRREPCMSVGLIKTDLDQRGGVPREYGWATNRKKWSLLTTALDRLVRQGRLGYSLGSGLRGGHEVRCYEPAPQPKPNPTSFTVYIRNELLGKAHFVGTFPDENAAHTYADEKAAHAQRFMEYEVWTGTPRSPGRPTGYRVRGT